MIGPVTARDETVALGLVDDLTADPPPGVARVRLDTDPGRLGPVAWAERNGLKVTATTTVMEYGRPLGGDPSRLFVPVMQALGQRRPRARAAVTGAWAGCR